MDTLSISPDSVITANPTICNGSITTLSVSGGSLGTGANWFWYIGSCGGLFEGNGDTIYVNPTITTDYYVRGEGICDTTSCGMIAINVNSISVQPDSVISANPAICNGSIAVLNVAGGSLGTGANWAWYSGSCGGLFEGNGNTIYVSPTITTDYFVRGEGICDTTSCILERYSWIRFQFHLILS